MNGGTSLGISNITQKMVLPWHQWILMMQDFPRILFPFSFGEKSPDFIPCSLYYLNVKQVLGRPFFPSLFLNLNYRQVCRGIITNIITVVPQEQKLKITHHKMMCTRHPQRNVCAERLLEHSWQFFGRFLYGASVHLNLDRRTGA